MMLPTSLFLKITEHNDKIIWVAPHIAFTFCYWVYNNKYKNTKKKHTHKQKEKMKKKKEK
jgi:hypothetical protein